MDVSALGWELGFIFLLILANGYFAASELAILAARKGKLAAQAEAGDQSARIAIALAENPGRFLPTVQIGITLVGTLAAAFGGARLVSYIAYGLARIPSSWVQEQSEFLALSIVVLFISFLSVLFGELVPKRLALQYPVGYARAAAIPLNALAIAARPAVWVMDSASQVVLRLLGIKPGDRPEVSVEDIEHLIEAASQNSLLEPVERQVLMEALRLGDRTVRDIMQPRVELDALEINTPQREVLGALVMAGHSRLPIYKGDLDHIVGFIHLKDVLRHLHMGWSIDLNKLVRPAIFVPETLSLDRLLVLFREKRTHLAIVLDEFGGTEGMVTLDSLLAELVGEIRDEHRRDGEQAIIVRADQSLSVDGLVQVDDVLERLAVTVPRNNGPRGFSTMAGLVHSTLGRIPTIGENLQWQQLEIEVVDMDGPRIDRLVVRKIEAVGESNK